MKIFKTIIFIIIIATKAYAQNSGFGFRTHIAPTYTFFEIAPVPEDLNIAYRTYGGQKGKIGKMYNFEASYTTTKNWAYAIGYSHYMYKQYARAIAPVPNSPYGEHYYIITTNLYNNLRYAYFESSKDIRITAKNFLYLGLGINFAYERMQYIETGPKGAFPREYVSTEFGSAAKIGYEYRTERGVCIGAEAKYIHLISVLGASDLSFGPYLKVRF